MSELRPPRPCPCPGMTQTTRSLSAPTVAVTLGYDLPRNPGQLGVRGAILEHPGQRRRPTSDSSQRLGIHRSMTSSSPRWTAWCSPAVQILTPALWGEPVHPTTVIDERRDRLEYELLAGSIERRIPVLGVCRGLQVINVALGGTLVQDLPPAPVDHRGDGDRTVLAHELRLLEGSRLAEISERTSLSVNTAHHQAVGRLGRQLVTSAWAEDGCVEAIEWADDDLWLVAVQYHPEDLHPAEPAHLRLFTAFLDRARDVRLGRERLEERTPCTT